MLFPVASPISSNEPSPPTYNKEYSAEGFIILPYAKLEEPFTANYDPLKNRSRVDYYEGTMKTFQFGSKYDDTPKGGAQFKVI